MRAPQHTRPRSGWAPLALYGLALAAAVAFAAPPPRIGPVWSQSYDLPDQRNIAYDLVVDAEGNAYSVFRTGANGEASVGVAKYNTTGQRLWVSGFGGDGSVNEDIWAHADGEGNLVVTGTLTDELRAQKVVVAKLSSSGEVLWNTVNDGAAGDVAVDASGAVFVAGDAINPQDRSTDALLLKLSGEDGSLVWRATLPGEANTNQHGNDVVADEAGGVYLAGTGQGTANQSAMMTARFEAANGAHTWTSIYARTGDNSGYALTIGLSGTSVIVAGTSRGFENYDFVTIKYNASDGQQQWVGRYDGPETGVRSVDEVSALTIDAQGNAIVTGFSRSTGAAAGDFATVKYDGSTGAELWVARYDGPGAENINDFTVDFPYDLRADAAGSVYVTGDVVVARSRFDLGTIKYDAGGQRQWVHLYNHRGLDEFAPALGIDSAGNAYVHGTATLRVNAEGTDDTAVVMLKYLPSGQVPVPPPPVARPTFTFSDSARDRVVCTRQNGEQVCEEATTATFKVASTATLQNVDFTAFNAETNFALSVGGLDLARTLGDDPRYVPGSTRATFVENVIDPDQRTRKALTITLSWPRGKLKVGVVSTPYFDGGIVAGDFLDQATGRITDTTTASVSLGGFTQEFTVAVTGKVTTRPTRDGEFSLSTVTLTGKGSGL